MSKFVSTCSQGIDRVHVAGCRDLDRAKDPVYPAPDNLRESIIDNFADVWSDEYDSTEAALADGCLEAYQEYIKVLPCAVAAGYRNSLEDMVTG